MAFEIFTQNLDQIPDASVNSTRDPEVRKTDGVKFISVQIKARLLTHADGTLQLQESNDGVDFVDIPAALIQPTVGASDNMIKMANWASKYLRCNWTKGSNTAGTIDLIIHGKN